MKKDIQNMTTFGAMLYRGWKRCNKCKSWIQKKSKSCKFCKTYEKMLEQGTIKRMPR